MTIGEIIQLTSTVILTIGVIIAFAQVFLLKKQMKEQYDWYRKEKGILYSSLFHPELRTTKSILEDKFNIVSRSDAIPEEEFKRKAVLKKGRMESILNSLVCWMTVLSRSWVRRLWRRNWRIPPMGIW